MRLQTIAKILGKVLNYSISEFSTGSKEDKIKYAKEKIVFLNEQGNQWVQRMGLIKETSLELETLYELKEESETKLNQFKQDFSKESMRVKMELKAQIIGYEQEIANKESEKATLQQQADEIQRVYKKEFFPLKRFMDKKKNVRLLEQYRYRDNKLSLIFAANAEFSDAAGDFSTVLFTIKDLCIAPLLGNDTIKVYEDNGKLEASIDIIDEIKEHHTFLVSVNVISDEVEIGKFDNKTKQLTRIGSGKNFHSIKWIDENYNDKLVVLLYTQLVSFKASLKNEKKSNEERLKHSFLAEETSETENTVFQ